MFKFGFSTDKSRSKEIDGAPCTFQWFESKRLMPDEVKLNEDPQVSCIKCGDVQIKYVASEQILSDLKNGENPVVNAEQSHSDLITAVYEGGLKVWECTFDLINFIDERNVVFTDKKVLDLGCGAGIVGILSSIKGARTTFQDYNNDVIRHMTLLNVSLNDISLDRCAFYSGDWSSFLELIKSDLTEDEKFDYIFTSETIYNTDNYDKLISIFRNLLKKSGTIYLAAKYYYFGVGGGVAQFQDRLKKEAIFNYSTAWECTSGVKRAILEICLKQS